MPDKPSYEELEQRVLILEKALQKKEIQYRGIVEDLPILLCTFSPDWKIMFVNRAYCTYFDKTFDELVGTSFLQLIPESDRNSVKKNISALTMEIPTQTHQHRVIASNGDVHWQRWTNVASFDENGQLVFYHSFGEDITIQKQTEDSLRESEHKHNTHLQNTPIGAISWDLDFRVIEWNPAAESIFGYSREESMGKHAAELILSEDVKDVVNGIFRDLISEKGGARSKNENITKDGTRIICDWYNTTLKEANGKVVGVASLVHDITDRKRSEEALLESEIRYQELFENINCGVAVYEVKDDAQDFIFKNFNRAGEEIDNDRRERLIGKSIFEVRSGAEQFGLIDVFRRVWHTGESAHHPVTLYEDEQMTGWYDNYIYKLPSGDIVAVFENVTERKRIEADLKKSEKELSIKNQIADIFLTIPDEEMYVDVLNVVLEAMESPYGTFAYIDENGDRLVPSMTRDIWNECKMPDKGIFFPRETWDDSLWGRCLIEKKSFSSNGPFNIPDGHIHITRALATPIIHKGESIGNFMVGDKPTDYTKQDVALLEAIADNVAPILYARLLNERYEKERKYTEAERESTILMLEVLNAETDFRGLMQSLLRFMQDLSGCDAVGIRLRDGDDFLYYETSGFSDDFVAAETHLCVEDIDGQLVSDKVGNPVLECMCGNIICGRFDSSLPFFTKFGSFISNGTSKLLASTTEEDRQARTRNRCNAEGYESVFLAPLRSSSETFGLLQFNDHREGCFPPQFVAQVERLAGNVAIALSQRKAEESLRESLERLKGFDLHSTEGVYRIDMATPVPIDLASGEMCDMINRHAVVGEVNDALAQMYGLTPQDMIGRPVTDFAPYYGDRAMLVLGRKGCRVTNQETEDIDKYGNPLYLIENYHGIVEDGHLFAIWGAQRDITELKKMEARLQEAQKIESIGNLAGGIAHDFNNILFPIVGLSEILLEDLSPNSLEYENAQEILKAGKRGSDLVQQILAFSRQTEHKMIPVRLQQILKEVVKLTRSTIPTNIKISQHIQSDCGLVMADPTQIHQIAMNLITNAYHAVEQDSGEISVKLKETDIGIEDLPGSSLEPGRYAMFSVSDTGDGIDPAVMERIFEPYFTTKEQGKGTGLGLSVVFGIVKGHRGDIKVDTEIGKGTTFGVYLPLITREGEQAFAETVEIYQTGTERILLIDDEEAIIRLETQILKRLGYNVTEHTSSMEALNAFMTKPFSFDLVISDMSMPNMTGDKLAQKLIEKRPDIPIIICTGFSERIDKKKAAAIGIKGFLMKPIVKSYMAKMVRKFLDEAKGSSQE